MRKRLSIPSTSSLRCCSTMRPGSGYHHTAPGKCAHMICSCDPVRDLAIPREDLSSRRQSADAPELPSQKFRVYPYEKSVPCCGRPRVMAATGAEGKVSVVTEL